MKQKLKQLIQLYVLGLTSLAGTFTTINLAFLEQTTQTGTMLFSIIAIGLMFALYKITSYFLKIIIQIKELSREPYSTEGDE